jgi:hypothetical protein
LSASPALQQWLDKTPNEFGRLALVFHFIEWYSNPEACDQSPPLVVSVETARRARRFILEFVYPHVRAFHQNVLGRAQNEDHAAWIGGFILARGLRVITLRDIYKNYIAFKPPQTRPALLSVMQGLVDDDWLSPDRNWPPSKPHWVVNPAVHELFAAKASEERERRLSARNNIREEGARRNAERQAAPPEMAWKPPPQTAKHPTDSKQDLNA